MPWTFHTPRGSKDQRVPGRAGETRELTEGFSGRLFSFSEKRKKRMGRKNAGRAMPAATDLIALPAVNVGATIGRPPWLPLWGSWRAAPERDIHKPRRAAASLPFRGGKPLRRRRADEGISPYKVQRKIEGCGRTESSAPTGCDARSEEWCACIGMAEDVGYEMKGAGLHVYR